MQEVVGSTPILSTKNTRLSNKDNLFLIIMFSVYIIFSAQLNKYYVGHTENIKLRLTQHNEGISTFTSKANDWIIKYSENFNSREEAYKREMEIKRKKSRRYIEWLIASVG